MRDDQLPARQAPRQEPRASFIVEAGGVGYEVNLPGYVESCLRDRVLGSDIEFYILYHHPEQATRPKLFGFNNQLEREFFEELTRVKDVGRRGR